MRIVLLAGIATFAWTAAALAEKPTRPTDTPSPSTAEITKLVRDHAFKSNPNLNPQTEFRIQETNVNGLLDTMKLRVFTVDECDRETHTSFNQFLCVYHNGKVQPFGATFGGHGLTSGVVLRNKFYYTCSFGSGRRLSLIGRIELIRGELKIVQSEPHAFPNADLLVSADATGTIRVLLGQPKSFNQWENETVYGTLDEKDPNVLKLDKSAAANHSDKKE